MRVYEKLAADYIDACRQLEIAQQRVDIIRSAMGNVLEEAKNKKIGIPITHRECQILGFLSQLMTNKEIANKLNISERTVKFHISNLLSKHGVKNRTQLVISMSLLASRVSQQSEAVDIPHLSEPSCRTFGRR